LKVPEEKPQIVDAQFSRPGPNPVPTSPGRGRAWVNILLFVLTFFSALLSQVLPRLDASSFWDTLLFLWAKPAVLVTGLPFAATLLTILLAHEMGHYLTARRYGVDQTLPYFIPAPTLFGTLGAVILMRSRPKDRSALLNVAVAGPFAGLVVALPAAAWGLAHSTPIDPAAIQPGSVWFGSSFLFHILEQTFSPNGTNVALHQVGLAGWVGLFITSLNLIPAAQLDGGHIAYALFGERQYRIARGVVIVLVALGIMEGFSGGGVWLVWAVLLIAIGLRHPAVQDEATPLTRSERAVGWVALLLFVLTFTPTPIDVIEEPNELPQIERRQPFEQPLPGSVPQRRQPRSPPGGWPQQEFRL
jgi:membrane-associated protease RseP (regulator of RpoE activity)